MTQLELADKMHVTDKAVSKWERNLSSTILCGVALAMGIAVTALSIMKRLDTGSAIGMPGIGLACITISKFNGHE